MRGRARVRVTPTPAYFRLQRRLEEGGARALRLETPPAAIGARPALRPLRARGFLVAARFLLRVPSSMQARADPLRRGRWPQG